MEDILKKRSEGLYLVLYDMAKSINSSENLEDLYASIHKSIGKIFDTSNFFIALYDAEKDIINFPYFIDELDEGHPIISSSNYDSLTVQVITTRQPLFLNEEQLKERRKSSVKPPWGSLSKVWVGIPLTIKEKVVGIIALQSYKDAGLYTPDDIPLLSAIAEQVAIAIDHKRAEEALKESEIRFRYLIENNSDITFITDSRWSRLIYCSPAYERVFRNEIKQGRILEIHPEDERIFREVFANLAHTSGITIPFELRIKDKDNIWRYFEAVGTNLTCINAIKGIVINLRDITERKNADTEIQRINAELEKRIDKRTSEYVEANMKLQNEITGHRHTLAALKESEEHYRLVVENASVAIAIAQDGYLKFANPKLLQMNGHTMEEVTSVPFINLIHEEDRSFVMERYKNRIMGNGMEEPYEFRIITKIGEPRYVQINAVLFMLEERPATLNFLIDITERKKAEEKIKESLAKEKELNELKSRFITMASHEFRTPLTSILSSADILRQYSGRLSEEKKESYLYRIKNAVANMTLLLNDILLVEKYQAGAVSINRENINIGELCENIIEQFNLSNQLERIKYEPVNLNNIISLDQRLMRQVLENLLSNALKYSTEESEVMFKAEMSEGSLTIEVSDKGIGIPDEDIKRLFEPFHRAVNAGNIPGTGLGLSIVKRAVEMHGGTISLNSSLNNGTTFFIKIPIG